MDEKKAKELALAVVRLRMAVAVGATDVETIVAYSESVDALIAEILTVEDLQTIRLGEEK